MEVRILHWTLKLNTMKVHFTHPIFAHRHPETGEYERGTNQDGTIVVEGRYVVCPECQGHGNRKELNVDIKNLDYTRINEYLNDSNCPKCEGKRVIIEPIFPDWALQVIDDWHREEADTMEVLMAKDRS